MDEKIIEIIEEIGNHLTDKTTGILFNEKQLENEDEKFGSTVTLTYLQRKIYPLLEELLSFVK